MPKIIFLSRSSGIWCSPISPDSYVEGFTNALSRMGNNCLSIITNEIEQQIIDVTVEQFAPEVIFSINNEGISESILKNTNCPIFMVAGDSIPYLKEIQLIKKNLDRYIFLNASADTFDQINDYFATEKIKNLILGHVTDFKKIDTNQNIEVSFIGSLSNWDKSVPSYFKRLSLNKSSYKKNYALINRLKTKFITQYYDTIKIQPNESIKILNDWNLPNFKKYTGFDYRQSVERLQTSNLRYNILREFTEFSLKVFSYPFGFVDVCTYDMQLFNCFDFEPIVTLSDAERIYNSSKISLNLPHSHASNGMSWRVPDILASNACLLSNYVPDLKKLMSGYIDIPMYRSSLEAKELAVKLLKDEIWRNDIVCASQIMIEDKCRFEKKLLEIEKETNIILEDKRKKGSVKTINKDIIYLNNKFNNNSNKNNIKNTERFYYKLFKLMIELTVYNRSKRKYLRNRFNLKK